MRETGCQLVSPEKLGAIRQIRTLDGLGQFVLVVFPPLEDLIKEIWETAKKSKVIDFESFKRRAKARPADVA